MADEIWEIIKFFRSHKGVVPCTRGWGGVGVGGGGGGVGCQQSVQNRPISYPFRDKCFPDKQLLPFPPKFKMAAEIQKVPNFSENIKE